MLSATCEACGRSFKAPASAAGKKTICPKCGGRVRVAPSTTQSSNSIDTGDRGLKSQLVNRDLSESASPVPPMVQKTIDDPNLSTDIEIAKKELHQKKADLEFQTKRLSATADDNKRCPFCGEQILAIAKKCKHCKESLAEGEELQSEGQVGKDGLSAGSKVLVGILAILASLIAAGVTFFGFSDSLSDTDRNVTFLNAVLIGICAGLLFSIRLRIVAWGLAQACGIILMTVGLVVLTAAANMDTTVGEVHNIGKMQSQQNGIIIAITISGAGLAIILFGWAIGNRTLPQRSGRVAGVGASLRNPGD